MRSGLRAEDQEALLNAVAEGLSAGDAADQPAADVHADRYLYRDSDDRVVPQLRLEAPEHAANDRQGPVIPPRSRTRWGAIVPLAGAGTLALLLGGLGAIWGAVPSLGTPTQWVVPGLVLSIVGLCGLAWARYRGHDDKAPTVPVAAIRAEVVSARDNLDLLGAEVETMHRRVAELGDLMEQAMAGAAAAGTAGASRLREAVSELAAERHAVANAAEAMRDSVRSGGTAALWEMESASEKILGQIRSAGAALNSELENRAASLSAAIDYRTQSLQKLLSQGGLSLLDQLRDAGTQVAASIEAVGGKVAKTLAAQTEAAEEVIGGTSRELDEQMQVHLNTMQSRLQSGLLELAVGIDDAADRSSQKIAGFTTSTIASFEARLDEAMLAIEALLRNSERVLSAEGVELLSRLERNRDDLTTAAALLSEAYNGSAGSIAQIVDRGVADVRDGLIEVREAAAEIVAVSADNVAQAIELQSARAAELLASEANKVEALFEANLGTLDRMVSARTGELTGVLEAQVEGFADLLSTKAVEIGEAFDSRVGDLSDVIVSRTAQLATIADRAAALDETVLSRGQAIEQSLGALTARFDASVVAGTLALNEGIEGRSGAITDALAARANALEGQLEAMSSRIETLLAQRGGSLVEALADRSAGLIDAIEKLQAGFSARADLVEVGMDEKLTAFDDVMGHRARELTESLGHRTRKLGELLTESSDLLVNSLGVQGERLVSAIAERGDTVREELRQGIGRLVEDMTEQAQVLEEGLGASAAVVSSRLDKVVAEIEGGVAQRVVALIDKVEDKADQLETSLAATAASVTEALAARTSAIEASVGAGMAELEAGALSLESRLTAIVATMGAQMAEQGVIASTELQQGASGLGLVLDARRDAISQLLSEARIALAELLDANAARATEILAAGRDTIDQSLLGGVGAIELSLTSSVELAAAVAARAAQKLDASGQDLSRVLETRLASLEAIVSGHVAALDDVLAGHASGLDTRLSAGAGAFDGLARNVGETIEAAARATTDRAAGLLLDLRVQSAALEESLEKHRAQISDALETGGAGIAGMLDERLPGVVDAVGERVAAVDRAVKVHVDRLDEASRGFVQMVGSTSGELVASLGAQGTQLTASMVSSSETVVGMLSDQLAASLAQISSEVARVGETVTSAAGRSTSDLGRFVELALLDIGAAESRVSERFERLSGDIRRSAEDLVGNMGGAADSARSELMRIIDDRLGVLPEAIVTRTQIAAETLAEISGTTNAALVHAMDDLGQLADRLDVVIADRLAGVAQSILLDVGAIAAGLDTSLGGAMSKLQAAAGTIDELVSMKAVAAVEAMERRLGDTSMAIERSNAELTRLVTEGAEELESTLKAQGGAFVATIESSTRHAEESLVRTGNALSEDIASLSVRWKEEGASLNQSLRHAQDAFKALRTDLGAETSAYAAALREAVATMQVNGTEVENQVASLKRVMVDTNAQLETLSGDLANRTLALDQMSHRLQGQSTTAAHRADAQLEELERLIGEVPRRLGEIAGPVKAMVETLRGDLDAAQRAVAETGASTLLAIEANRSRIVDTVSQTREVVSAVLATGTRDIEGSLAAVTAQVESALGRTLAGLEQRLAGSSTAIQAALGGNAEKIDAAVGALSKRIQKSLGLGGETLALALDKSAASVEEVLEATSRRTLKQMGALADSTVLEGRRAGEAVKASHMVLIGEIQSSLAETQKELRQAGSSVKKVAQEVQEEIGQVRSALGAAVQDLPREPKGAATAYRHASGGSSRDGNIARVTQPVTAMPTRSPRAAGGAVVAFAAPSSGLAYLNQLIAETEQYFIPGALREAWEKYRSGEATAFGPSLYTQRGLEALGVVARKLDADPSFVEACGKFLDEFEAQLRQSADGPDATGALRALLSTVRGHAYSLLAYAAGRLK
jgi:hypothetical protein